MSNNHKQNNEKNILTPLIGQTIPDFEGSVFHEGKIKTLNLKDLRGKWLILFFYPADFSFICPTELGEMADLYEDFIKQDAEVVSVSTDTVYVHKAWHDKSPTIKNIKFPMLADPAGKLSRALGTYLEEEGLSLRASFVIDPDGIIQAYEINSNDIGRNGHELLRKLQAAKHVRENKGEVCPVSWKPGGKTLKPSVDLVGEI